MIRHLRLHHWRSYDTLDLDFEAGTTFIVAPNGVGKTSLVLALAWALYGDSADLDPRTCIRAGADSAEVDVTLALPDGRDLTIARKVTRRGRPTMKSQLDGASIEAPNLIDVLEKAYEVKLDVAANLSTMLGGGQLASEQPLDLKSHLYTAFGVTGLLRAAESAEALANEAERQRALARTTDQTRLADRKEVETRLTALEDTLRQLRSQREPLQSAVLQAEILRHQASQMDAYHDQLRWYSEAVAVIVAQATEIAHVEIDSENVEQILVAARREAEEGADLAAESNSIAKGSIAAATEAVEALSGSDAYCPTCLRAIDNTDMTAAVKEHKHRLHEATQASELFSREQTELRSRGRALADLISQFKSLSKPAAPDNVIELTTGTEHAVALETLEAHNRVIGGLQIQLQDLTTRLLEDDRVADSERALYRAYRREAIAIAAAISFRRAAVEVIESLIEPVATEITWRWKCLFPHGGLTLRSDGTIVREQQGEELGWGTLSDGERIWARIITHLLVVSSSTQLPFVWFDEPLEHLDPQLRQAVAATLATATTQTGNPKQLLVTTYEHALARQLADDTPNARLINVRSE